MVEDKEDGSLSWIEHAAEDQKQLDQCAEGFKIERLSRLMGHSDASSYTTGLEDLYEKMLVKIESLARQVELSSAKVFEQVGILYVNQLTTSVAFEVDNSYHYWNFLDFLSVGAICIQLTVVYLHYHLYL